MVRIIALVVAVVVVIFEDCLCYNMPVHFCLVGQFRQDGQNAENKDMEKGAGARCGCH